MNSKLYVYTIIMEFKDNTSFFAELGRLHRLYVHSVANRLAPHGIRPGYLSVLHFLWQRDGLTQTRLRELVDVEQATLSNTLKRMERDGLITREPNREDRRISLIWLTGKARDLHPAVDTGRADLRSVVNKGLSINDIRYFRRIIRQMTEHLEADLADPALVLTDVVE
ncbi:MarR family winged helix-turn-helix transcriptional regulator [Pseudodesulfovibrio tunisiensis]|uniref:MarR family winged helix-turn-helix transcriptional regulator n=1 Tax=Pseudodesulfovibrio tunisiensis TaxID=463192 RepID=UPI001FB233F2|nr:MarR family transcriptional regulator [Pseudodesulfovibrio tunisiensis]